MIETKLTLSPTNTGSNNSLQLCILNIKSTFFDGTFKNSDTIPTATFDISTKTIDVKIEIMQGVETKLEHDVVLYEFPFQNSTWSVDIEYIDKGDEAKKPKTIQMDINIEPRPTNQFAIQ